MCPEWTGEGGITRLRLVPFLGRTQSAFVQYTLSVHNKKSDTPSRGAGFFSLADLMGVE